MIRWLLVIYLSLIANILWAQDRVVTLSGLPVWDSAPLLHLVETQPLSDIGIRLAFQPWRTPEELGAMLVRGDVQVANVPSLLAPIFAQRGLDLAVVGTSAPEGNITIVYRQDAGEIAVPFKGGMPDLILRALEQQQLTPRYTATPVEAMQLLLSNQVEAAFLAQPFITIADSRANGSLTHVDACALWREAHKVNHCPATGVFLASSLTEEEQIAVSGVLATSYAELATKPSEVARLLLTQFPMLSDAPLVPAFSGITPHFQPICDTSWLVQTLRILAPLAPYSEEAASLSWAAC